MSSCAIIDYKNDKTSAMIYIFYIWSNPRFNPNVHNRNGTSQLRVQCHFTNDIFFLLLFWFKSTHVHKHICSYCQKDKIFTQCANHQYHTVKSWYCFFHCHLRLTFPKTNKTKISFYCWTGHKTWGKLNPERKTIHGYLGSTQVKIHPYIMVQN